MVGQRPALERPCRPGRCEAAREDVVDAGAERRGGVGERALLMLRGFGIRN